MNCSIIALVNKLLLPGSQSRSTKGHYNKITTTPDNRENTLKYVKLLIYYRILEKSKFKTKNSLRSVSNNSDMSLSIENMGWSRNQSDAFSESPDRGIL